MADESDTMRFDRTALGQLLEDPQASDALRDFIVLARTAGPSKRELDRLASKLASVLNASAVRSRRSQRE